MQVESINHEALLLLDNFTCKIKNPEAITQSAARNNPPSIQLESWEETGCWDEFEGDSLIRSAGPLYNVAINAPVIDTIVPSDLARVLELFQSNSSILKAYV